MAPKTRPATYSFSCACRLSAILVALPMQTSSTPVASGSSVPACPTFKCLLEKCLQAAHLTFRITSAEVQRQGLSMGTMMPDG